MRWPGRLGAAPSAGSGRRGGCAADKGHRAGAVQGHGAGLRPLREPGLAGTQRHRYDRGRTGLGPRFRYARLVGLPTQRGRERRVRKLPGQLHEGKRRRRPTHNRPAPADQQLRAALPLVLVRGTARRGLPAASVVQRGVGRRPRACSTAGVPAPCDPQTQSLIVDDVPHYGGDRLIWHYDVHLLAQSFIPAQWQDFVDRASRKAYAQLVLKLSSALPHAIKRAILNRPARHWQRAREPVAVYLKAGRLRQGWIDFASISSPANRLRFARELAFPPIGLHARQICAVA